MRARARALAATSPSWSSQPLPAALEAKREPLPWTSPSLGRAPPWEVHVLTP